MTIEEAIKTIELAVAEVQQEYQMDFAAAFDVAVSALCAKEEKPSGGWISVEDRLPEVEDDVLVRVKEIETYGQHNERKKTYNWFYVGYYDGTEWLTVYCHGCEYLYKVNESYSRCFHEVTHWMPLPELPKEGDYDG